MSQPDHFLSNEQLLEVFALTKTATAIHVGEDAVIQTANDAMLAIWGKDRSIIGKSLEDALPELKGQPFIEMFRTVWLEGLTISGSDTAAELIVNGQAQTFYFDFEYRAILGADGKTICILHSAIDVTDRFLKREALERAEEKAAALDREQALNEELAASNEELGAVNEELKQSQDSLHAINTELEDRVARRVAEIVESEERFKIMAEGTDIMIAVGDETGDAVFFNEAWTKFTGRSANDLLQFGWVDLVHPEDKTRVVNAFTEAFANRKPFAWEFRVLNSQGDYRWLLAQGPPRFRHDESFAGYISSCVDITDRITWETSLQEASDELQAMNEEMVASNEELAVTNQELLETQHLLQTETIERQKAIERLKANDQNLRNMVRQAPVGMCIVEGDPLYMVEINDSFLEIIGKTREEIKRPYWEVVPEAESYYRPITEKVFATGETYHAYEHEIMLIRKGVPEIVHIDFVYEPMKDADGKTYAIMIVAIDVTDKVVARKQVEQAEEMLRFSVEAANAATWYLDVDTRKFIASPRLKELFGFDNEHSITYDDVLNSIPKDYQEKIHTTIEKSITSGTSYTMEHPIVNEDGIKRWVRALGKLYDADGSKGAHFSGLIIDITEQKQDELRKNDFIGMVSHELKTPLTTLTAIVQILNSKLRNNADAFVPAAIEKANVQVKKMSAMINGFLNVSRLESGKIQIEKTNFDLDELVEETITEVNLTMSSHHIVYHPCHAINLFADRDKIGSVISNLLSNAVKYSPKDTEIDIACTVLDKQVQISVKDSGLGVRPEDAEKLFERYYRVESSNTRHISGFGIGLYLSAEIIQRHHGKIWVDSEFGNGATFSFTLPLA